jgi:hypothetical protein
VVLLLHMQLFHTARQKGVSSTIMAQTLEVFLASRMPGSTAPHIDKQVLEDCYQNWVVAMRDIDHPDALEHCGPGDDKATQGLVKCPGCAIVAGHVGPDKIHEAAPTPGMGPAVRDC